MQQIGVILGILLVFANCCAAQPNLTIPNNTEYAANFQGATWAEQINTAVAALPATGGTVDAQGLCAGNALSAADTNVVLGSQTKSINLKLGACTYPLAGNQIQYFQGTVIAGLGNQNGTLITFTGSGAGIASTVTGNLLPGVNFHDFAISGDNSTAGSIGIDGTYLARSTLTNVFINHVDTGWVLGGTGTGAYYNVLTNVIAFVSGAGTYGARGGWLALDANQNQIFSGAVRANATSGIGLQIDSSSNQIYSLDIESNAFHAIELTSGSANGNAIVNPYLEAVGYIVLDSGANRNSIVGSGGIMGLTDNSGNTTNYIHWTGGGGSTNGYWPYYEAVNDALAFGLNPVTGAYKYLSNFGENGHSPLNLLWNSGSGNPGTNAPQYGMFGHAPLEVGELIGDNGLNVHGLTTTGMIATPAAPTITQGGTPGGVSDSYYVVCHDKNGGVTLPSSAGSTTTEPTVLSGTDYNIITWPAKDGCWKWDILKGNTDTSLAILQYPPLPAGVSTHSFKDIGQATSAYTPPTRNTTADVVLPSTAQIRCANGGAIAITNGALACP